MLNLYTTEVKKGPGFKMLEECEKASVFYHNLFDFPMNFVDLVRWRMDEKCIASIKNDAIVASKNGYHYFSGRDGLIYKRTLRKRISGKKTEIAKKASKIISFIPSIKMVAVTGSLAMQNSDDNSDIDLMIVTKAGSLWTTRLLSYFVTSLLGVKTRRSGDKKQKDKLCLNMWMDENDLIWHKHNIYSAHEIAQIVPLINKNNTYEKFLLKNKWILSYWPNAVRIKNQEARIKEKALKNALFTILDSLFIFIEKLAFNLQKNYMKKKISREVVTPTRALFHPQDWSRVVMNRLSP